MAESPGTMKPVILPVDYYPRAVERYLQCRYAREYRVTHQRSTSTPSSTTRSRSGSRVSGRCSRSYAPSATAGLRSSAA